MLGGAVIAYLILTPQATSQICSGNVMTFTNSILAVDPDKGGRHELDGVVSTCAAPKACAVTATGIYRYDKYRLVNLSGGAVCYTVTLNNALGCGVDLYSETFSPGLVTGPGTVCDNYLADIGNPITAGSTASYSFTVLNGFTFDVLVLNANTAEVCTGDYSLSITPCPTLTFACPTLTGVVAGGGLMCAGGSNIVTVTVSGSGATPYTVALDNGGGTQTGLSGQTVFNFSISPGSDTTYSLDSIASHDSLNCQITGSGSATVTLEPPPTAEASGSETICNGDETTIMAHLTGTGPWRVTWSDGVTQDPVDFSPATRSVSPSSTTTYTVIDLSDANCTAQAGDLNGSATVTVNPRPTAVASGSETICNGGETTIMAHLTGTSPWRLTWSDGVTQDPVNSSPATRNVSPSSTTAYTVFDLSDANCTALAGDLNGSAIVTVKPRPTSFVTTSSTVCDDGPATIRAYLTGTGPWRVTWSDGVTQNPVNSSPATRIVDPSSTTTYTVTSLRDANCTAQVGDRMGSATVTSGEGVSASLSASADAFCGNSSLLDFGQQVADDCTKTNRYVPNGIFSGSYRASVGPRPEGNNGVFNFTASVSASDTLGSDQGAGASASLTFCVRGQPVPFHISISSSQEHSATGNSDASTYIYASFIGSFGLYGDEYGDDLYDELVRQGCLPPGEYTVSVGCSVDVCGEPDSPASASASVSFTLTFGPGACSCCGNTLLTSDVEFRGPQSK